MGKNFTNNEVQIFETLVKMSQPVMKKTMRKFLRKQYKKVIETKEYVYAEGDIPVALVAHMDTVFKTQPEDVFYDRQKNVMWSPDGLGADDRAGVFMIMNIVKAGFRPHIIFTTDEEIGGLGAKELSKKKMPFKELSYIIQLDRRGTNDCVFYDCDNPEFTAYIEKFGFVETWGTFTDISYLCPAWGVAGVNLSVGYENEHSAVETLHVNAWKATFEKVKNILSETEFPYFKYIPVDYAALYGGMSSKGLANNSRWWNKYAFTYDFSDEYSMDYGYPMDDDIYTECDFCHTIDRTADLMYVKAIDGTMKLCCYDCLREMSWCDVCDQPFEIDPNAEELKTICPSCAERLAPYGIN